MDEKRDEKKAEEKLTDDDHIQAVKDLLGGHGKAVPQYDRHANKHLYESIATPDKENTIKELIDDGTLITAFDKLLSAYIKTADLGDNAKRYLTDISLSKEELKQIFAGRLGKVYGPDDATFIKDRLMEKLRLKVRQGVDFSLGNIDGKKKLHEALDYIVTEGQVEDQFPTWKDEVVDYGDTAKQITGQAINSALSRYELRGRHRKAYDKDKKPTDLDFQELEPRKFRKKEYKPGKKALRPAA